MVATPRASSAWSGYQEELEDAADYQARVPEAPNMAQLKRCTWRDGMQDNQPNYVTSSPFMRQMSTRGKLERWLFHPDLA